MSDMFAALMIRERIKAKNAKETNVPETAHEHPAPVKTVDEYPVKLSEMRNNGI